MAFTRDSRARLFSLLKSTRETALQSIIDLQTAQTLPDTSFDMKVKFEIAALRREMGQAASERKSDADLKPHAVARTTGELIAAAAGGVTTASAAIAAFRNAIAEANAKARSLDLPELLTEPERRGIHSSHALLLEAMRGVSMRLDRQDARERAMRIQDLGKLLAWLQAAESSGDVMLAIEAERELVERLAAGPVKDAQRTLVDLSTAKAQHKAVAKQFAAHRDLRVEAADRQVLGEYAAAEQELDGDLSKVRALQTAFERTGIYSAENAPARTGDARTAAELKFERENAAAIADVGRRPRKPEPAAV